MNKWVACGSFSNPKRSKEFVRFSSKVSYSTKEEAESEANQWRNEKRYAFIWVEEGK